MRVDFRNLSENLIIILFVVIITSFTTYKITVYSHSKAQKETLEALTPAIIEAINKAETQINQNIRKLKQRQGSEAVFEATQNLNKDDDLGETNNEQPKDEVLSNREKRKKKRLLRKLNKLSN